MSYWIVHAIRTQWHVQLLRLKDIVVRKKKLRLLV